MIPTFTRFMLLNTTEVPSHILASIFPTFSSSFYFCQLNSSSSSRFFFFQVTSLFGDSADFLGLFHDTIWNSISSINNITSAWFFSILLFGGYPLNNSLGECCLFRFILLHFFFFHRWGEHFDSRCPFLPHLKHLSFLPSVCTGSTISSPRRFSQANHSCLDQDLQSFPPPVLWCLLSYLYDIDFFLPYCTVEWLISTSTLPWERYFWF